VCTGSLGSTGRQGAFGQTGSSGKEILPIAFIFINACTIYQHCSSNFVTLSFEIIGFFYKLDTFCDAKCRESV